ncbi:MAG: Ca2+-binding RTX toxin-like protein [Paracoccaceae bacterium]
MLYGGDGDDLLSGGAGADTIYGETGDDAISRAVYADGGESADKIIVSGAGSIILGGGGDDVISFALPPGATVVTAGEADETVGDTLAFSALTRDLTTAEAEAGRALEGCEVLSFVEIERIILGGGTDQALLADRLGDRVLTGFDDRPR